MEEAVNQYQGHIALSSQTVQEAAEAFQKAKAGERVGTEHQKDLRRILGHLCSEFGEKEIGSLRPPELAQWLEAIPNLNSRRNIYTKVNTFFTWAMKRDIISTNPLVKIDRPKVKFERPEVFSPNEMKALLDAAEDDLAVMIYLVLGGFAGLRSSEIIGNYDHRGLHWEEIDFERGEIYVPEEVSKTRERLVAIQPALLRRLEPIKKDRGPVRYLTERNTIRHKNWVMEKAGIQNWPRNVLRHSYGSYHLAMWEDVGKTALQMGHTDPTITHRHYARLVRKEEAEAWWNL